jgi:hypothetical protein
VGERRPRRRDFQDRRRAPRSLWRQGHHARQGGHGVLPDRRAQRSHVVRPPRAARFRARAKLRRLVDGMGQPRRRTDREGLLTRLAATAFAGRSPPPPPPDAARGEMRRSRLLAVLDAYCLVAARMPLWRATSQAP